MRNTSNFIKSCLLNECREYIQCISNVKQILLDKNTHLLFNTHFFNSRLKNKSHSLSKCSPIFYGVSFYNFIKLNINFCAYANSLFSSGEIIHINLPRGAASAFGSLRIFILKHFNDIAQSIGKIAVIMNIGKFLHTINLCLCNSSSAKEQFFFNFLNHNFLEIIP